MTLWLLLDPLSGARPGLDRARSTLLAIAGGRALDCADAASLHTAIRTIRDGSGAGGGSDAIVAVSGGDAGLSAVITAMMVEGWPPNVRLLPLGGHGESLVRDAVGVRGEPGAILKRYAASQGAGFGLRRPKNQAISMSSLRIVCSATARPKHGFVFGAGAFYRLADRGRSAPSGRLGAVARGFVGALRTEGAWARVDARVAVDRSPFADGLRAAAATTLDRLPLGLRPFKSAADTGRDFNFLWHDMTQAATAALAVPLSRGLVQNTRHKRARPHTVHIDMADGFVLDGALHTAPGPQVISIEPGASIPFLAV